MGLVRITSWFLFVFVWRIPQQVNKNLIEGVSRKRSMEDFGPERTWTGGHWLKERRSIHLSIQTWVEAILAYNPAFNDCTGWQNGVNYDVFARAAPTAIQPVIRWVEPGGKSKRGTSKVDFGYHPAHGPWPPGMGEHGWWPFAPQPCDEYTSCGQ